MGPIFELLVVLLCCLSVFGHPERYLRDHANRYVYDLAAFEDDNDIHYQDMHSGGNYNEYGDMGDAFEKEYEYDDDGAEISAPTEADPSSNIYCTPYTSHEELPQAPAQLPVAMELWSPFAVPQLRKLQLQGEDESGEALGCVDVSWGENYTTTVTTSTPGTCVDMDVDNDQEKVEQVEKNVQQTQWPSFPPHMYFYLIFMASENSLIFSVNGRKNETVSVVFSRPPKQLRLVKLLGDPQLWIHHSQQVGDCVAIDWQCRMVEAHLDTDDVVFVNPSTSEGHDAPKVDVSVDPCANGLISPLNTNISGWRQLSVTYTMNEPMNDITEFREHNEFSLHTITALEGDNVLFSKNLVHPYSCQNSPVKVRIYHSLVSLNCEPIGGAGSNVLGTEPYKLVAIMCLAVLIRMFINCS